MKPDHRFLNQPKHFWANVRLVSEQTGYTVRGTGQVRVPTLSEMGGALRALGLDARHVVGPDDQATALGRRLLHYFTYRAQALNEYVKPRLMSAEQARRQFQKLRKILGDSDCPIPMNK